MATPRRRSLFLCALRQRLVIPVPCAVPPCCGASAVIRRGFGYLIVGVLFLFGLDFFLAGPLERLPFPYLLIGLLLLAAAGWALDRTRKPG